jgi:hypothetical protein
MNDDERQFQDFVSNIKFDDSPDPSHRDKLEQELFAALARQPQQQKQTIKIWRIIMKSRITKLATAVAVIVVALLIMLDVISNSDSVVWAEVLDNANQAEAFAYRMKMNLAGMIEGNDGSELEAEVLVSKEYGVRIDSYRQGQLNAKMYLSTLGRRAVTIMPKENTRSRMTLTDALFEKAARENGDPRKMVEKATKYYDTELGRHIIDGIEVEGIACHDPIIVEGVLTGVAGGMVDRVVGRLWADTKHYLPVRLEVEIFTDSNEKLVDVVTYDYQWNIQIDPNEFIPEIPDDGDLGANVVITADVESTMQGLSFFAEQAGGKYPTDLSEMTIGRELREALRAKFGGDVPWPDEQEIFFLQMAIRFYTTLVFEDREPAYYGDKVTAEFPNAVLMRWREDDGLYKVIFGDLSTKQVTAGQLVVLEATPLNPKPIAVRPQPSDSVSGIITDGLELVWMPGADVTQHRVYFGTEPDALILLAEVSDSTSVKAPALQKAETYFWRVDETQPDGSVLTGDIWSFDTGSLVAWWKLDDGAGDIAVDSSGNGHDGSLRGNTSWVEGVTGNALLLDGQDGYINVGRDPAFNITNQITVSAWIKVGGFDREWQAIVTKGDRSWRLQRNYGSSTLEFACSGLAVPGAQYGSVFGIVDVDDGRWHHAAGTYDGQELCLYLDGKLDVSSEAAGKIRVDDRPVYIGENAERPDRLWNGLIDDVRIYSYALSAAEIDVLYEETRDASAQGFGATRE